VKRHHDPLDVWLQRFGRAWEERDPERAAALFSEDGCYRESPFDGPLCGTQEIHAYWSNLPAAREDIRFPYDILAVTELWGIAHWHGSYTYVERATRSSSTASCRSRSTTRGAARTSVSGRSGARSRHRLALAERWRPLHRFGRGVRGDPDRTPR